VGPIVPGRAAIAREMRKVIEDGTDLRTAAFWSRFCDDPAIHRDVTVAVEAPDHLAAMLATRAELSVVAATALLARHDEAIAETIASRADLTKWLCDTAVRIAGPTHGDARRRANTERSARCGPVAPTWRREGGAGQGGAVGSGWHGPPRPLERLGLGPMDKALAARRVGAPVTTTAPSSRCSEALGPGGSEGEGTG
jgi:hypothetical protein